MSLAEMVSERPSIFKNLRIFVEIALLVIALALACAGAWNMLKSFEIMGF